MSDLTERLVRRLATSATGYAVVIDGVLDLRTVAPDQNSAARRAIIFMRIPIIIACDDPGCDCAVILMKRELPEAKIVTVSVEVTNDAV